MAWDVEVRALEQDAWPAWEKFVSAAPGGSVYSLPGYLDALCTAAGGRFRILAAMRGEEIVGGVALYERTSRGGAFVSPRLLLYYNGVVVRRYETQYPSEATARHVKILTALEAALSGVGLGSINLRSRALHDVRPFLAKGWTVAASYSYVVPLDLETAWGRVEQNLRRLIGKTANVVLGTAFGIASGVVVDTHVQRISRRLDLTKETDPVKIEKDLMKILPKEKWILFSHQIIHHGRALCLGQKSALRGVPAGAAVLLER